MLVAETAKDFRALVVVQDVHHGLIVLSCVGQAHSEKLPSAAIDFLVRQDDSMGIMVNHVLEVFTDADMTLYPLPTRE